MEKPAVVDEVDVIRTFARQQLFERAPLSVADLAREIGVVDQTLSRFIAPGSSTVPKGANWRLLREWATKCNAFSLRDVTAAAADLHQVSAISGSLSLYRLGEIAGHAKAVRRMLVSALSEQDFVIAALEKAALEAPFEPMDEATAAAVAASDPTQSEATGDPPVMRRRGSAGG